ncbi:MAG: hypothetical protein LBI04_02580 [Treponema sp.]|jgi:uncharacterized protein (TIGR03545 family)|nr:hypothetical protein [Treponema sp.]
MSSEKTKQEKPAKPPSALKKPLKSKVFEKRYIKYIEHPGDRKFFTECFEKQDDNYVIRKNLTKADVKKIKTILKWVKTNKKSPVKAVPLVFAGAVAAAVVLFFTIFANPLLSSLLETALEAIFEAKTDVTGFRLSILKFEISIKHLTIANKNAPMKNLIEMDKTGIKMKPEAVLRGKIYIEWIKAETIQFGTERTVSGTLPGWTPKVKEEKVKSDGPPLVDLQNFDAMALLNQEFDKLSTPKLYDTAITVYNETVTKWQTQVEDAKKQVEDLRTASQPILNINTNNLRDIETIRRTIQDVNTMVSTVQAASSTASGIVSGIETDINTARRLEQDARNALTDDINHLKSYIDLGSGAAFAAIEPFIRDMLSDTAEQYIDYGLIALDSFEKLSAKAKTLPKSDKPKKEKKVAFKGRDVIFPTRSYPTFYLGLLSSDFTLNSWNWDLKLREVSSDPDLTKKPVSLNFGVTEVGSRLNRQVAFSGNADFRTDARQRFNANINGGGFPVSLGNSFDKVGISGLAGNTAFKFDLSGYTNGGFSTEGGVNVLNARLLDPIGTIAEAAAEAVSEAGHIDLGVSYEHRIGQSDIFRITTNIANLLADALKKTAAAYAQKAMQEIERALREKIDEYIDGRFVSKDQIDMLLNTAKGDRAAIDQLKTSLTNKQKEFEQKLKGIADEAAQQVKEQGQQAVQDVLQGNKPTIQAPSLPSTGGLKLPGR